MNTRLLCAPLIAITIVAFGCAHHPPKSITRRSKPALQAEPSQSSVASAPNQGAPADSSGPADQSAVVASKVDVAGALAKQTEQFTRTMQDSVSKYTASHAQSQPAGQEAMAKWVDPTEFRIGPADSQILPSAATTRPAQAADTKATDSQNSAANQTLLASDAKKIGEAANTPAVIPEPSADSSSANANPANRAPSDELANKLAKRVKDFPRDLSAQLDYQLLLFLEDQSVPDLSTLAALPTEDRELLSAVLDGISNFRNTLRADNNMLLSQKIHPLTELADRLQAQADLAIPTLALCTRVDSFGRYEPIDPPRFVAGKENQAIIYCELQNFSSQIKGDKKEWETDITQQAVLYMESGEQVWSDKMQQITDQCRNRRHDFFLRTLVTFPSTLTIGRYSLKVTIVDKQTNRVAEASLPIQIVAQ